MLLDFVFELEQFELMRCISLFDSWYDKTRRQSATRVSKFKLLRLMLKSI